MYKERFLVDAVVLEGRSAREVAKAHGVSKSWIYELVARFRKGGYKALKPRSRRPQSCKHQVSEKVVKAIVKLRKQLERDGHDAGAHTIAFHLAKQLDHTPSVTTIWRILKRKGLVVPKPQRCPHSSIKRFQADLPNQMWQADVTHWHLADGSDVEILNFEDDHSRLFLASDVYATTKAADVVGTFHKVCSYHGLPASLLTDNGAVFTAKARKGKVLLESELERLGIVYKNSRPYHPQTCGKVERLHQTLKKYLAKQAPAKTNAELQVQLDRFVHYYNNVRPHRALGRRTPLQAFNDRVKAGPVKAADTDTYFRVRNDKVDKSGSVTLRHQSRLYHIGIGRAYKGQPIRLLIADRNIRVVDKDGQLIRQLTLDPNRNYQPINGEKVSTMSRDMCPACPET